jgi:hypothetical protein
VFCYECVEFDAGVTRVRGGAAKGARCVVRAYMHAIVLQLWHAGFIGKNAFLAGIVAIAL